MTAPQDAIRKSINNKLRELFDIIRQRKQIKNDFENEHAMLKDEFVKDDEPLAERQTAVIAELHDLVVSNKSALLGTLKSFMLAYGAISFKAKPLSFKVTDKDGLEDRARKDGKLTTFGKFERVWKPDPKVLEQWMKDNPTQAGKYEPFVDRDGGYDNVYAKPNGEYFTTYDPNRLSDESVKLEPAKQEEDAEDA